MKKKPKAKKVKPYLGNSKKGTKRQIRQMQVEWNDSFNVGTISKANKDGLEGRAFRLLTCNDNEWLTWLDDLDFWKMGWRPVSSDEDKV